MVWLTPSFAAINLPPSSLLHSRVQRPTAAADTAAADRLWDALMLKLMLLLLQLQLMLLHTTTMRKMTTKMMTTTKKYEEEKEKSTS